MLLYVSGEICETNIAHALSAAAGYDKTAIADGSSTTVEEHERLLGGERFVLDERNDDHRLNGHEEAVLSCPEMNKRVSGEVSLARFGAVDGLSDGPAMRWCGTGSLLVTSGGY